MKFGKPTPFTSLAMIRPPHVEPPKYALKESSTLTLKCLLETYL